MDNQEFETLLGGSLKRQEGSRADEATVERVLAHLISGPLPRQDTSRWHWPTVLLDWQFAPAWPRVAALACCAALGFTIGIAGLDRRISGPNSAYAIASRADLGSVVFEPEALTGARP